MAGVDINEDDIENEDEVAIDKNNRWYMIDEN
jgi:hypothetical protein